MNAPRMIELPSPEPPVVTRVIAEPPLPMVDDKGRPIKSLTWTFGAEDPLIPTKRIVRMFLDRGEGVDIYSVAANGTEGVRYHIPIHLVRFTEEGMPLDMFADEIAAAQSDGEGGDTEDDPDPGDPEEEGEGDGDGPQPAQLSPNGQPSS